MLFEYGGHFSEFPIKKFARETNTDSRFAVHDIFQPLPDFMRGADLIFTDSPWSIGNIKSFYTKAGISYDIEKSFADFSGRLFDSIHEINPERAFLVIGNQHLAMWIEHAKKFRRWGTTPVRYYLKHPCHLVYCGRVAFNVGMFAGEDETEVTRELCASKDYDTIGDLCAGRGYTPFQAFKNGKRSVCTELNPKRMAYALWRIQKSGGNIELL
jgi:hypothetical protein